MNGLAYKAIIVIAALSLAYVALKRYARGVLDCDIRCLPHPAIGQESQDCICDHTVTY